MFQKQNAGFNGTEPPMWTRRNFLGAAAAGACAFLVPGVSRAAGTDPVVVALFQRGAADGLNLVVPQGDPDYYGLRPNLSIPEGNAIDLDGFFGIHPGLSALQPLYANGAASFIHAVGSPDPTRSHFDAQDFMDRAAPGNKSILTGWLNRTLERIGGGMALSGVTLGGAKSPSMIGAAPSIAFKSVNNFRIRGSNPNERGAAVRSRYGSGIAGVLGQSMSEAFEAVDEVGRVSTDTSVSYPNTSFGRAMRDIAALIKADIGVRVVSVNTGGWDTHSNELPQLDRLTTELAEGLAAFHEDLGSDASRTLLLAMTEFGRKAEENGAGGSEHGHGGAMICLGGGHTGGQVRLRDGIWPGLASGDLHEGRDLQVTTDFRDVFAEVLDRHMGLANLGPILPGHSIDSNRYPGLFS